MWVVVVCEIVLVQFNVVIFCGVFFKCYICFDVGSNCFNCINSVLVILNFFCLDWGELLKQGKEVVKI